MQARGWVGKSLLAGTISTLGLVQSCADDSVSLRVICNVVPTIDDDRCVYEGDADTCLGHGVLNLAANNGKSNNGYTVGLVLQSGLNPRTSTIPLRAETNGIQVKEFEVEVQRANGATIKFDNLPNPFTISTSGYIPPKGRDAVSAQVLPAAYVAQLTGFFLLENDPITELVLSLNVRGETDGQVPVETSPWTYPVTLVARSSDQGMGECYVPSGDVCPGLFGQDDYAFMCACGLSDSCQE